jgi:hypothetical protein
MKPGRFAFLPALLSAFVTVFPFPSLGDDDDAGAYTAAETKPGSPVPGTGTVHLTAGQQKAGGLTLEPLKPASYQPEATAWGRVLDIQPLLELRMRYRAARADSEVAAAALELAEKNRARLGALHKAEIIAGRELVQAEAQWRSDRAKADASRRLMGEIRREAQQAWGTELAHLALDGDAPLFDDLLSHRRLLLLVALPPGFPPPSRGAELFVARDHDRAHAATAELISAAPRTDELVQGETWFFHTAGERLRAGMRINVWVSLSGEALRGVVIPLSAVVWHAGKPWVYRRIDDENFARAEVAGYRDYGGSWFVERGFEPGDSIVVAGGQMLLSEEFRGQIPDEDDD